MEQGAAAFDWAATALRRFASSNRVSQRPGLGAEQHRTVTNFMALGGAALIVGWLGIATTNLNGQSAELAAKSAELGRLQAQLASVKSDSSAMKGAVAERAAAIEKRQAFLAALLTPKHNLAQLAAMLPREGDVATARALLPGSRDGLLEPFHKLESEQLAFVDKATYAAEARLRDTQSLVRRLGLDPERLMAASSFEGSGGPYLPVRAPADAEPRFKGLFLSWKKLHALENALVVIPSYMPVKSFSYTSGFGVRYDPFTSMSAMHAGVDMAGKLGEPIYAAASGTVGVAGWSGAYGNCVEVEHGKGLATRYGHLSAILVRPGQVIHQGDVIARMGSTGRSTGTHLHFEVRIDGRAVNPRPYLDASAYVLAAQARSADLVGPGYAGADAAL